MGAGTATAGTQGEGPPRVVPFVCVAANAASASDFGFCYIIVIDIVPQKKLKRRILHALHVCHCTLGFGHFSHEIVFRVIKVFFAHYWQFQIVRT